MILSQSLKPQTYLMPSYISPESFASMSVIFSRGTIVSAWRIFASMRFSLRRASWRDSGRENTDQGQIDMMIVKSVKSAGMTARNLFFEKIK